MIAGALHTHHRRSVWQSLILAVGILLAGCVFWLVFQSFAAGPVSTTAPSILPATSTSVVTPSPIPLKASVTSQPPTNTLTPVTPTPEPSLTPTELPPQIHALDVPIMMGKQPILMHRVIEGEQLVLLVKQQQTTVEVLQAINRIPPVPLIAGKVIVIAPGLLVVDPNLPLFEPYQVTDKEIGIGELAGKLGVDLAKLKYYNRCMDVCRLVKGDWLLVPPPISTPTPVPPTPQPSFTPTEVSSNIHALEVPIMVGVQPFLLHRVIEGEQMSLLAKHNRTTIEVLQAINYNLPMPLFANRVIVIAPGLLVVDPNLPSFETYQVTDKEISIEDLVLKLGVDLNLLKYYNRCPDTCQLVKGDWLLIPHTK